MANAENNPEDPRQGHRRRLREKFLRSGLSSFHDYEVVELLLSLGTPRRDCKAPAKEAIKKFGTLRGVLEATPEELQEIKGIGPHNAFGIRLVQEVAREYLRSKILEQPFLHSSQEVFDYLYHAMRGLKKELFKVLYLNSQNQIIETADIAQGTVDSALVSPREVIEGAIRHKAAGLIFVHNHPSGNPEPSESDRELTRELVYAARLLHLRVLDHIIIGDNRYYSFAGEGLIERFDTELLEYMLKRRTEAHRTKRLLDPDKRSP
ncbi:MAG: DNA repair protein RadC [Dehalococcoidales bacterium]|nr:DNA repair protein RadC [Dehalococcoidales bacterium]